jgi:hypothetical protein
LNTHRFVGWLWLLSGVPVGIVLVVMPPPARLWCFHIFAVLETAHSFSPIVLAWTHKGFRQTVMWPKLWKYIGLPAIVFTVALGIGLATSAGLTSYVPGPGQFNHVTDLTNPFPLLVWGYSAWNLYHFGMQDFGIWRLWGGVRINRWLQIAICLGGVIFFVEVIRYITHSQWVALLVTGLVSVNHWVVDLGLSSQVVKRGWLFIAGVLSMGLIGFVWMVPSPGGTMIRMIPWIICARLGLGMVHFLYSRWVWKLSNPLVRATIGRDLLAA